jgi:hypothetical protein
MKKLIILSGALLLAAGATFVSTQNNKLDPDSLIARNIEALGQAETGNVHCTTVCHVRYYENCLYVNGNNGRYAYCPNFYPPH